MAKNQKKTVYEEEIQPSGVSFRLIGALVCFGIALLIVVLTILPPEQGTLMQALKDVMHGIGGSIHLLLSIFFGWIGVLFIRSMRGKKTAVWRIVVGVLLFLCVFTAVHLFSVKDIIDTQLRLQEYPNFVDKSYQYGKGGGMLGALMGYFIYNWAGSWGGLFLVLFVMLLLLTFTGHTIRFGRWLKKRGDQAQYQYDQHRKIKNTERMFEFDEPMEAPLPPPVKQKPPVNKRPPRRIEDDYMYIADNMDEVKPVRRTPVKKRPVAAEKKNKSPIYNEKIDPEACVEPQLEPIETQIEIPKSLREIRSRRTSRESSFEMDVPSFMKEEKKQKEAKEAPVEAETAFKPEPPAKKTPAKKVVVEGVRAVTLDDAPADDDEPPFDIPDLVEKKKARMAAKQEKTEIKEEEGYNYPPIDLLEAGERQINNKAHSEQDRQKAEKLISTLESFGIETRLIGIAHGPAVTRFELQPAAGVKVSRITSLADDIALNLAAVTVRIEAPIPGKAAVGVEIPNEKVEMVRLREVLECNEARRHTSRIAVGLGKDNSGRYIVADIAKMPHVLIAGQTGSGKSVCINSIISSILYRATPEEVKMILIDPKVVELSIYNDIPHLIAPVVTDPKKAASALDWAVAEMTGRYKKFAERGVRQIKAYNASLKPGEEIMPQIVIIIDELADLMMVSPGEVEDSICRLAQLARAAGMHLVIATQRPSVNVITGIIKANIPTRIAFSVASQVDSRTMIDHGGAEKLLGNGDMLFVTSDSNKPIRVQGAWVSDDEVSAIVDYIKQRSEVSYDEDVVEKIENSVRSDAEKEEFLEEYDARLEEAVEIVIEAGQASVSMLQRRMRVGYARAGRLIDEMERRGIVSEADGAKPRSVLISREEFHNMFDN